MSQGSVSVEMLLNDAGIKLQRSASNLKRDECEPNEGSASCEGLPLFEFGREFSCDGLAFLSRENSNSFPLSREVSQSFARENSISLPLSREVSQSFARENSGFSMKDCPCFSFEPSLVLSRENSQSLNRESSVTISLGRESSVDFNSIITSASVHELLRDEPPALHNIFAAAHAALLPVEAAAAHKNFPQNMYGAAASLPVDPHAVCTSSDHSLAAMRPPPTATAKRGAPRKTESRRGLHVKGRPDMQQTARDGARHWSHQLKVMRAAWAARAAHDPEFHAEFQGQINLAQGRIKSKQECLLRTLQLAAADGLISPGPCVGGGGFFGWARFDVVAARAGEFRKAVEGMFAKGFREDTLKETFRRAGLVPERWRWAQGWTGEVPWLYNPKERE